MIIIIRYSIAIAMIMAIIIIDNFFAWWVFHHTEKDTLTAPKVHTVEW